MAAKAYRLLRAILMTAVEEDKILPGTHAAVRGAGDEHAPERPVLTVAQVFALAELDRRRPIGNIRKPRPGLPAAIPAAWRHDARLTRASRHPGRSCRTGAVGAAERRPSRRPRMTAIPCTGPAGRVRQPAMGRSDRAAPMRPRHGRWHRPSPGRLHRAVQRPDHSRSTQVPSRAPHVSIPATILPDIAAHLVEHTKPEPGRARVHRDQGRPAAAEQLQQDSAAGRTWSPAMVPRWPARPRPPTHRKHPRRVTGRIDCAT